MKKKFQEIYGIKHYGFYKPSQVYQLEEKLYIAPGNWEMINYGCDSKLRQNVSYFLTTSLASEEALMNKYRDWLIFDSFILNNAHSIHFYDENMVGNTIEEIPSALIEPQKYQAENNCVDYDDIGCIVLLNSEKQFNISYKALFNLYKSLDKNKQELIRWFVAKPFRSYSRLNPIFDISYSQILHLTVLLEKLIGNPPNCNHKYEISCECGFTPQQHYSQSRREWYKKYLQIINNVVIENQYRETIEKAFALRNKIAHTPSFNESKYPDISVGSTDTYECDRANKNHGNDRVAFEALLVNLDTICRNLLLREIFALNGFESLSPLIFTKIGG